MTGLLLAVAWSLGIGLGLWETVGVGWALLGGAASLSAACLAQGGQARMAAVCLALLMLGLARASSHASRAAPELSVDLSGSVAVVGRVADAPLMRDGRASFDLEAVSVQRDGEMIWVVDERPLRIAIRRSLPTVSYGDVVEVRGRLGTPRSRPGYPLASLLGQRGIVHVLDATTARVLVASEGRGLGAVYRLRESMESSIRASLPEPHASLVAGVALGTRSGTPPELKSALSATGTSHIVAVSGFNVAVVAGVVSLVMVKLVGRPWAIVPALVAVWGYTALVGAPPSAVRAALMASFVLLAGALGRLADALTSLAVASAVMLAWDPSLLLDLGFQLSILATAGLVLFVSPIADRLTLLPRIVRAPVAVALAIQLVTFPLILASFHTVSVVAPLTNLLVGAAVPALMVLGGTLAVLGPLPGVGTLSAWATFGIAEYVLEVITWTSRLPGAVVHLGRLPIWVAVAWYVGVILWASFGSPDLRSLVGRRLLSTVGAVAALLLLAPAAAAFATATPPLASLTFLDVDGASVFVRSPTGRTALISGTASGHALADAVGDRLELWERTIDVVVLARDSERVEAALGDLLARYRANLVIASSPTASSVERERSASIVTAAGQILDASQGHQIDLGAGVTIGLIDVREHENSKVLDVLVEAEGISAWLPGPGEPSSHWRDVSGDEGPTIVRLPGRSLGWLAKIAPFDLRAIIVETAPVSEVEGHRGVVLDHRGYGSINLVMQGDPPELEPERCPFGPECRVVLN